MTRPVRILVYVRRQLLFLIALVMAASLPIGVINAASDTGDCDYAFYRSNYVRYSDECANVALCGTDATGAGEVTDVQGANNAEKIFNYLKAKGFTDAQAAGVLGNIQVESGGTYSPTIQEFSQPFPQGGWGLVQWTGSRRSDPNPNLGVVAYLKTRPGNLLEYYTAGYSTREGITKVPDDKEDALLVAEMDFLFKEISRRTVNPNAVAKGFGKSGQTELAALRSMTSAEAAAKLWVYSFEIPADIDATAAVRAKSARSFLAKYGTASGSADTSVCNDADSSSVELSGTSRNKIVQVAQAELAKWQAGTLKPGNDFRKYLQGARDTNWCAYFASWVYEQAGISFGGNGAIATVTELRNIAKAGDKFEYHPAGSYVPKPGDLALYESHVNIVVSASSPRNYTTIGGNELGGQSSTSIYKTRVYQNPSTTYWATQTDGPLDGFLSPKGGDADE